MRIYENGIYRDMTPEEIAELEKLAAEAPAPVPEPTPEERIAALEKADSTRYDNVTMTAAGWKGKTYSFEAAYPSDLWNIVISVAATATSSQYDAFAAAKVCGSPTSNVVTALGEVPLVNIPLIVKAVRK